MSKVKCTVRWSIIAAMVFVLTLAAGCGSSQEIKLGAKDNNRQIEMEKGQTLVVTLDSNPTTGFRWERVASEGDLLQQAGEAEFRPSSQEKRIVGAGGQETLRFKAEKAGQTTLELVYHRPWEKETEPADTFTVQVVIR